MYRDVIIGAVHDLGYGSPAEVASVHKWRKSEYFQPVCDLAQWDEEWVVSVMRSVAALPSVVARQITRECVVMLKAVAKLGVIERGEMANMPLPSSNLRRSARTRLYEEDKDQ